MPVLGEGRAVGHVAIQAQATEPAIGKVEVGLLAQAGLRADAVEIAYQQHADHQLRVHRRPAGMAVVFRQRRPHDRQIERGINPPKQMISGNMPLQTKVIEQLPGASRRPIIAIISST